MKKIIWFIFILVYSGCASMNPFYQFYQDRTGGIDVLNSAKFIPPPSEPQIYRGTDIQSDGEKMMEDGYVILGLSSFNAGDVSEGNLKSQAKRVNASIAIFYSQYTNTISGSVPLTLPDNKTVATNHYGTTSNSGSIYGYGGYANYSGSGSYYGSSTSTIYGTKTTYIPYSQNRYDYLATFWIKARPPILGVYAQDLTTEERQTIGSNKGVSVITVIKDSPAFLQDILKGDILKKINGSEITDSDSFMEAIDRFKGQEVIIELLRNNQSLSKKVKLNMPEEQLAIAEEENK